MSTVSVSLFGKFNVRSEVGELTGLEAFKTQELLGYLLINRNRPHSREALAALFWGDYSTLQSRKYLRQTLWQINSALQDHLNGHGTPPLLAEQEWVQFNENSGIWIDVAVFEQASVSARGISGDQLSPDCTEALRMAVQIYRGDLLEGCYEDWCLFERERLQNMYLAMLDKLLQCCEAHQEYEAGLAYGQKVLRNDRARERTHRQIMRLYYLAGNRTDALRQYQRCVAALHEELGVKPSRRTVELYEWIRADRLDGLAPTPASAEAGCPEKGLPEVLARLKQLQGLLFGIQREIQQNIDTVETVLNPQR
jgi:DNA-binding SARP family transcriptional activator